MFNKVPRRREKAPVSLNLSIENVQWLKQKITEEAAESKTEPVSMSAFVDYLLSEIREREVADGE